MRASFYFVSKEFFRNKVGNRTALVWRQTINTKIKRRASTKEARREGFPKTEKTKIESEPQIEFVVRGKSSFRLRSERRKSLY